MDMKNLLIFFFTVLVFSWCFMPQDAFAQEKKGKLGTFEDANKGKKNNGNDSDNDDDDDGDGGFLSFLFHVGFEIFINSLDDDNEDYDSLESENKAAYVNQLSFGSFPFDNTGLARSDLDGKAFLGRISGGYQRIDKNTDGLRLDAYFQIDGIHGVHLDFIDYTENLDTRTDHLQIFTLSYRNLLIAEQNFLLGGNAGLLVLNPDKLKDTDYGLSLALDAQWFIANPFSLNAGIGFAPIIDNISTQTFPVLWDLEIGAGIHFKHLELFGAFKTMIPSASPSAALYGPELGLRFWF
jgi:hypothetical protein